MFKGIKSRHNNHRIGSFMKKSEKDRIRQQKLESLGLSVLRLYDWDVKKYINAVVKRIELWVEEFEKKYTTPSPLY